MKKTAKIFMVFVMLMGIFMIGGQQVNAKTINKKTVVMEKASRIVDMPSSDVEKFKVSGKKYVKAKAKAYQIVVTGKKKEKTKVYISQLSTVTLEKRIESI